MAPKPFGNSTELLGEALGDATAELILAAEGVGLDIARARARAA
jgi:hypothetical protein